MNFELTDEQELIRRTVRDFAESRVAPVAEELDRESRFPYELVAEMAELGLMGIPIPEEFGGAGADTVSYAIAVEELTRIDSSVAITVAAHTSLGTMPIYLFGDDAHVFAHVAELNGEVVGIAVWFLNYSTWTGRPGIYLEDLFVSEAARGTGAGKALFKALAEEAVERGCARIDWAVLDWNMSAMDFYRAIGGRPQSGWQPWRIDGAALEALAR